MFLDGNNSGISNSFWAGTAHHWKNGTDLGGRIDNRQEASDLFETGDWVIFEAADCDFDAVYSSGGAQTIGWGGTGQINKQFELGFVCLIPTATLDTGTNRADLVAALAAKFGITL